MRCVVQRVDKAGVSVDGRRISSIGEGVIVFLGIEKGDRENDADYLAEKIPNLRIFEDDQGKMNLSLLDIKGGMLVVSQFTVLGDCRKGRRPSFTQAEEPGPAKEIYHYFISKAKERVGRVAEGAFQTTMLIEQMNNGPVTLLLDSRRSL